MMNSNPSVGLYVHIPFCLKKCRYCDFYSGVATEECMDNYLNALCTELEHYRRQPQIAVDSVFIGGGTPTLFGAERLCTLLRQISSVFSLADTAEVTVEMNPATADKESLVRLKKAGVNRISLGVQSFHDGELQLLGRAHNAEQAKNAVALIKETGFHNFSLDVMYAIPHQTLDSFKSTLEQALSFSPSHLSLYSLILEEGTDFWEKKEKLPLPTEAEELEMYTLATDMLKKAGYIHYEISNYAKEGMACKHNLKYWQLSPYIGIGTAAHSFFDGARFANKPDLGAYLREPLLQKEWSETITRQTLAEEYVMLGLRTAEGISLKEYQALSGKSLLAERGTFINKCIAENYIIVENDCLRLTESGFYVSTAILAEFLA